MSHFVSFDCSGQIFLSAADLRCPFLSHHGKFMLKFEVKLLNFEILVVRTYAFYLILQQICHRDLKLENTLLDGSPAPRLKICDFGYSKVSVSSSL